MSAEHHSAISPCNAPPILSPRPGGAAQQRQRQITAQTQSRPQTKSQMDTRADPMATIKKGEQAPDWQQRQRRQPGRSGGGWGDSHKSAPCTLIPVAPCTSFHFAACSARFFHLEAGLNFSSKRPVSCLSSWPITPLCATFFCRLLLVRSQRQQRRALPPGPALCARCNAGCWAKMVPSATDGRGKLDS